MAVMLIEYDFASLAITLLTHSAHQQTDSVSLPLWHCQLSMFVHGAPLARPSVVAIVEGTAG